MLTTTVSAMRARRSSSGTTSRGPARAAAQAAAERVAEGRKVMVSVTSDRKPPAPSGGHSHAPTRGVPEKAAVTGIRHIIAVGSVARVTFVAKKEIEKWRDSDRKWANLKCCNGDIFVDKKSIWVTTWDAYSAYVVHLHFYLGQASLTLCLKAMCITDGCTKVCALNALYKHFKEEHIPGTHTIHPLRRSKGLR